MHQLFDLLGKPLLLLDERGTVRFANQAATSCFERPHDAVTQTTLHTFFPQQVAYDLHEHIPQLLRERNSRCWRYHHNGRDFEVCLAPMEADEAADIAFAIITHDITEQEQLGRELAHSRRALEALNRCNRAMLHADNEASLLTEVCCSIVETGGYSLAWIGYAEHDSDKSIRPVAHYGFNEGYLEQARFSWGDNESGQGPLGQAIRTCQVTIIDNIHQAQQYGPWQTEAALRGYHSVIALPLCLSAKGDSATGALVIYAPEADGFDAQEVTLLTELANNLSHDIHTLRQRAELHKLSQAVAQSPAAVMITDLNGNIDYVNPRFVQMTGYSAEEIRGKNPRFLNSGTTAAPIFAELWRTIQSGKTWQGELQNRSKNGHIVTAYLTISPLTDPRGNVSHYLATLEDISERKAFEERLWQQSNFDSLTRLPNRSLLLDRLDQAIAGAHREEQRIALLLIDLDNFKTVNDSLGHESGDELLLEVTRRLQSLVREGDTLGRIDGDEFALIAHHAESLFELEEAVEAIRRAMTPSLPVGDKALFIRASIGIALYPQDGITANLLLKNADAAMHRAKQGGRNTYRFFTPELNRELEQRLQIENLLRNALLRNELQVYYQPQYDCKEGLIVGAEALLRWHSPQLGYMQPDHFIPLAEETGLILEIGEWVLQEACREARRWHDTGHSHLHISVNLSLRQFQHKNLVALIRQTLANSGLPPRSLELELTESVLMHDVDHVAATLNELKQLGVRLALDDFGTGYSSLSYLKRFPFDALKIDRAFVRDINRNSDDAALCEAIILMAQRLRLQVIAEGVESEEHYIRLCSRGAHLLQGFYFGKAMPAEAFRAQLNSSIP